MAWSDYYPFLAAPALREITNRIDTLALGGGQTPPKAWYETVDEIRELTGYTDTDTIGHTATGYLYIYDETETSADDGVLYLKPDDILPESPGRWWRAVSFSLAGHSHPNLLVKPVIHLNLGIAFFDWYLNRIVCHSEITVEHLQLKEEGKGLSEANFTDFEKEKLSRIPDNVELSLEGKMDIIQPTVGNEGNIIILSSLGNASDSGVKPHDMVHAIAGDEQTATQGNTVSYAMRNTGWTVAWFYFTLYHKTESGYICLPVELIADAGGTIITNSPKKNGTGITYTVTVAPDENADMYLNITIVSCPLATLSITNPKIIYN